MICSFCISDIPEDSLYCDQCGKRLMICPECGKLGSELFCFFDNKILVEYDIELNGIKIKNKKTFRPNKSESKLMLENSSLNLYLKFFETDFIGRKYGSAKIQLAGFKQISSKHAEINYKDSLGWQVKDLDSTNGTILNSIKLIPHTNYSFQNKDILALADIEFIVKINT